MEVKEYRNFAEEETIEENFKTRNNLNKFTSLEVLSSDERKTNDVSLSEPYHTARNEPKIIQLPSQGEVVEKIDEENSNADKSEDLKQFGLINDFLYLNSRFWGVSIPSVLAQLSGLLGMTISMFFIAYLNDPNKTAAVGLGVSVLTMLVEAPVTGMNGGISVLVSIAYGSQRYDDCVRALQLGRILTLLTFMGTLILL